MSCKISTGRLTVSQRETGVSANGVPDSSLFDRYSVNAVSRVFVVDDGFAVKLSTFNLPEDVNLVLHQVILGGGEMPHGGSCVCEVAPGSSVIPMYSEQFKVGCSSIGLNSCNNVLFLTVPGSYMLEVSDTSTLGNFSAFAEIVECGCLPDGLVIGNRLDSTIVGAITDTE